VSNSQSRPTQPVEASASLHVIDRYHLLFWGCRGACAVGLIFSIFWSRNPDDAGRAGAVAVAAALGNLFIGRDYGARIYAART
jgi:hypothetical protein